MIQDLIKCLADGEFHSGEEIAIALGLTRAAVWKQVSKLKDMDIHIDSVRGRGYRIRKPLDLLDRHKITAVLDPSSQSLIESLEIHTIVNSTSQHLKQLLQYPERRTSAAADQYFRADSKSAFVCLAEYQSAGRGRRGREWHAPFASSLCFSILWRFESSPVAMNGLSLAMGVAMVRALRKDGFAEVGLKWPNDIYWQRQKLGGILFEVFGEQGGSGHVIVGIGLNLDMNKQTAEKIDQPWTDLVQVAPQNNICRNSLAASLIEQASLALQEFSELGFDSFAKPWSEYDICANQAVTLQIGDKKNQGIARGVDSQGQLILDTEQGKKIYASGEVSLRLD